MLTDQSYLVLAVRMMLVILAITTSEKNFLDGANRFIVLLLLFLSYYIFSYVYISLMLVILLF